MRRRSFLGSAALGAAALAFPWLRPRRARAAAPPIPRRIIFFYTGGSMRGSWAPVAPPGLPAPVERRFTLGRLHQPLVPWQKQLLILDGLDMVSAELDRSLPLDAHFNGGTHALAAVGRGASPAAPGGISIDQLIASRLNTPAPTTLLPSLDVTCGGGRNGGRNGASALGPGQLVPSLWDPRDVFARAFPDPGEHDHRHGVTDFVLHQYASLAGQLSAEDGQKLDAHMTSVRDLERRLGMAVKGDPKLLAGLGSKDLSLPNGFGPAALHNYELTCDLNLRLVVAALATDRTRVSTVFLPTQPDEFLGYRAGAFDSYNFHDLQHKVDNEGRPQSRDPAAVAMVERVHLDQAARFAKLLELLHQQPEADGRSLLDHTVVLWCGQIGYGGHQLKNLPWMLAGGAGGYFNPGRYLKYERKRGDSPDGTGTPHNDLFVSLANAMGLPITTFGNPRCCSGPLARLRG